MFDIEGLISQASITEEGGPQDHLYAALIKGFSRSLIDLLFMNHSMVATVAVV